MLRRSALSRSTSALALGALVSAGLALPSASASDRPAALHQHLRRHPFGVAAPATTAGSTIDVVVPLHVSSGARRAVERLVHSHLTLAARRSRLRALTPTFAQAATVESWARHRGFTVTATTAWSVSLQGRADALASAFGSSLRTTRFGGKTFVTPRSRARVPAALAGIADAVVGLDTRPLFSSHTLYGGGDVQVLTSTPVRGKSAGAGATVATVNLSGWHDTDLKEYRHAAFGSADVAPATTNVVPVGSHGHVAATVLEDDFGMEPEVALDAETIAGVAPSANQRMYFGGNSSADYLMVLQTMGQDLFSHPGAFQTASTSWGTCELNVDDATLTAMNNAITTITAQGATFFAASGDSGAFGCGDNQTASVDFPAAAQNAVAVGGTSVTGQAPTYTSTAWNGSGGGCSARLSAPQRQLTLGTPCAGRAVPDIVGLADPNTGFWIYDAFDEWIPVGGTSLAAPASAAGLADAMAHAGLTNLPSPTGDFLDAAYAHPGAFTDVTSGNNGLYRASAGYDLVTGLGTPQWTAVEAALTGSPAPTPTGFNEPLVAVDPSSDNSTVFLDAPDGSSGFVPNGEPATGYALSGVSTTDCGTTSPTSPLTAPLSGAEGLVQLSASIATTDAAVPGGCIQVQRPLFVDTQSPTQPAPTVTYTGTTSPSYRFSWPAATDPGLSSGIIGYVVLVRDLTTNVDRAMWATTGRAFPYPTWAPLTVTPGHRYGIEVDAVDRAFNFGYATKTWIAPYDDRSASLSRHLSGSTYVTDWPRTTSKYDFMGSNVASARKGAYYALKFTGRYLTAGVLKSRYGGYADVYVDGVRKARISLYASSTLFRQAIRLATFTTSGTHTVVVKVVGAHQTGSLGNYVYLDSLTVT